MYTEALEGQAMLENIFEVTVNLSKRVPTAMQVGGRSAQRRHQVPAATAADAKRKMQEQYEQEGVNYFKMTAKKVW